MSTAFEVGGRPIISFTGDWDCNNSNNNNNFSATSTVVLDPAAFLANWKKQIQGKHNIPVNQQRLTFASNHCPYPGINLFNWSRASQDQSASGPVAGDFVTCLQSWQAILRSEKRNIARLLGPEVLIESDRLPSDLKSKTAEEIRDLGIPCSVYYLAFNKCVLPLQSRNCQGEAQSRKEVSNLCIKVDKDFQLKEFEVDLYGHLSKSSHPLHFQYHFNGRHLVAHLSMLEQTAQYRQGQKMRHGLGKANNTVENLADGSSTESLLDTDRTSTLVKQTPSRDYYLPGSKEQELTAIISPDYELRCVILTVITLDGSWERLQRTMMNGFNDRRSLNQDSLRRMQKNSKKEAGQNQQWNSQCLVKSTMMNHFHESKIPECTKKKGMLSAKSRKSKGSYNLESQPSKPEQDSGNFQTDRVNGGCSTKQSAASSKSDYMSKKSSKKKKKKKGKNNPKNNGSDASVPILKESSEESSLASGINVTSIPGSGHIPVCVNDDTNILKNNIKTSDLEMRATPKGQTSDGHISRANDLSSQTSSFLPQEPGAEAFAASTQNSTSNTLTEGPIHQIFENSKKINNHTIVSTEKIDNSVTIDGTASSLDHSSEEKGCLGFQTGSCSMNSKGSTGDRSDSKCGTVTKGRRVSDFHSIGNGTRMTSTNLDVRSAKSTFKAGGSSNRHLRGGSGGSHSSETGNTSDKISVDTHDRNKHITKAGRSRETQPDDKKVAGGKKVAGNNCGLVSSLNGSTNSSGIGNVHSRVGKENNHSVWQKVQKNTANDHINESGASDYIQLPSTLDSQIALSVVNFNSEKNTAKQISLKNSQENGHYESNHSDQKLSDSETYPDHGVLLNCVASRDVQCRHSVQADSHRSQHGRDDDSVWSGDRKTLGVTHTDVSEMGKDFEEKITGCCRSETSIQSCQKGTLDFSCQSSHPSRFPAGGSDITHRNAEMHDADQMDKWKSISAPSTSCQHGDVFQSNRDDSTLASSSSPIQGQVNQILPLSRISNSADQELLRTKNQGDQTISAVHISDAQLVGKRSFHSPFQKGSQTTDSWIRVSGENDMDQHFNMKHSTQVDAPVEINSVAMVMASTPDTGAASTQYMDSENNVHQGSSENYKLHASSDIGLKSTVSVQETDTSNHVEQKNAVESDCICEVSCKYSSYISPPAYSSNAEFKEMAQVISNSIFASYESQLASESIARTLGSPLAEFEKVLNSVSPAIEPSPRANKCSANSRKLGITNLACRCQIADIPLKNIWHWFEEPGNYGLEVKVEDCRHTGKFSIDGLFRAYFVPYLSGIQLFRFSASSLSCHKSVISTARQENSEAVNKVEDSYLTHFANLPILSTLLPKPYAMEKTAAPGCSYSVDTSNITSDVGNHSCSTSLEYSGNVEMEILLEYFESEQPQQRRPMLEKIRELIKAGAGSSSQVFGDPHILESIKLCDLHPASWFSVAWYPIYRIPEGQLRAAFLTYHSLGHFVHRDASPSTLGGDVSSCIVAPVVGLQSYSAQAEGWFVPKKQFELALKENIPPNPLDVLRERLKTLEETASVMARGCAKKDASSVSSKQSDYDFFLKRRK